MKAFIFVVVALAIGSIFGYLYDRSHPKKVEPPPAVVVPEQKVEAPHVTLNVVSIPVPDIKKKRPLTLSELAVKECQKLLYVREKTNHNDAPEIDKMLDYVGVPRRSSWCLACVVWCVHNASEKKKLAKLPIPKLARCSLFLHTVENQRWKYDILSREDVIWGVRKLKVGDIAIWSHSKGASPNWNGHASQVEKQISTIVFRTIEGNTTPDESGDQREGGGVYEKFRTTAPGSFQVEAFVRYDK